MLAEHCSARSKCGTSLMGEGNIIIDGMDFKSVKSKASLPSNHIG